MKKLSLLLAVACLTLFTASHALAAKLIIYTSVDEENSKAILSAFTKETGIQFDMIFLSSGPAMSRISAEKNNPQADVWFGAPNENHIIAKTNGLTQPYASKNAGELEAGFKDADGYWHAIYMNPLGFGVRHEELQKSGKPVPKSWQDLLNPEYKGMIQMPSPQSSGTSYSLMQTLIQILGEDAAIKFMQDMNVNVQTYTQSGTAPSQNLAIGETQIAIQFTPAFLKLLDQKYPVQVIFPEEGVGFEAAAVSIIKGAKNLEPAKALVDWIVSKNGQQAVVDARAYFFPIRSDVSAGAGLPSLSDIKLIDYDRVKAAADKSRLVDRWVTEVLEK
ncbi:ABC transporter substrate-binding protein [Desulfovibrio sp. OttesenSCG-928-I05]|nr:ABC transporter substrate-binding protein [Desulfovibrio sp. OttesenSCG-928-I05]